MVGLEAEAESHPYDLHVSQRRMVALAATLAMRTPVVILDEPTTGQDAAGVQRLAGIVDGLKAAGRTVVTISHDLDFCAEHFERVVVMSGGLVLADGPAPEILSQVALPCVGVAQHTDERRGVRRALRRTKGPRGLIR
jgi:energy-coupling factor transport system ATP-binding protein